MSSPSIASEISTGRAKCRYYNDDPEDGCGEFCEEYGVDGCIPKGEPFLIIRGWGAGGGTTFALCKKHAPGFLRQCREADASFRKLMKESHDR
jgi:hypothetical protein